MRRDPPDPEANHVNLRLPRPHELFAAVALTAALLAPAERARAQDPAAGFGLGAEADVVRPGTATLEPAQAPVGGHTTLRIPLEIAEGWHVYAPGETAGAPVSVKVPAWPAGLSGGVVATDEPAHELDSGGETVRVHEGRVTLALRIDVAFDAEPGPRTLAGTVGWAACDASSCLPPASAPFSVVVDVDARDPRKARVRSLELAPQRVARGGTATLRATVEPAPGWHVYGLAEKSSPATRIDVATWPDGVTGGAQSESPAAHEEDAWGVKTLVHAEPVTLSLVLNVAPDAAPGPRTVEGSVTWMACDDSTCNPTRTEPFTLRFEVTDAVAATTTSNAAGAPPGDAAPARAAENEGVTFDLILTALGLGFLTVLTPCVFPLLPITVSFFAKQSGPPLGRSLVYGAGIVFTIVVIGLVFKSGLDVFARGDLFNAAVAILFFVLSLSLFGLFDLRLPGFLSDWASGKSGTGGVVGAFFMAVTLALTSFSCSLPFLALMFQKFDAGRWLVAVVGLTAYASAMALPFVLCSLFPAALRALPRAGGWMNAVKVTMGFVELGLAFKFLRTVDLNNGWDLLPRSLVLAVWVACALGAALYLFGYVVLPHDTKPESIGVVRLLFALGFLASAVYLVPGVFGRPLATQLDAFLQTQTHELATGAGGGGPGGEAAAEIAWVRDDWDGSVTRAAEKRRPVLFDFTGVG